MGFRNRIAIAGLALVLVGAGCASTGDEVVSRQADLRQRLANLKLRRGENELAIREYQRALEIDRSDPETHFGLAEAYRRKGELALAEASLLEALRIDPAHQSARLNLSVVYLQQERWEDAIRETTTLVEDPTFLRPVRALVNRGWAHYKSRNLALAEADLREAVSQEGSNHQAQLDLALVEYAQGETIGAIRRFQRVIEILEARQPAGAFRTAQAETHFHLAQAYVKLGQREKALGALEVAVERGGDGEWGQKSKEYLAVLR